MNFLSNIFFLFFIFNYILCQHTHWWEDSKVLELTTSNFNNYISKDHHMIIEFYAPWCFYCKLMAPEYEILHERYNGENPKRKDVYISRIDGSANNQICEEYGIYSYPTIVYIPPNTKEIKGVYNNQRTADALSNWIESICGEEKKIENANIEIIINNPEKEIINLNDNKNDNFTSDDRIYNILITMADEIKFLDKEMKNGNDKIINKLQDLHFVENKNQFSFSSNSQQLGVFFVIGVIFGLVFAFTIVKWKNLKINDQEFKAI